MMEPLRVLSPKLRAVWRWFLDLHGARDYDRLTEPVQMPDGRLGWQVKSKALRVSPERIRAWQSLAAVDIAPWQFAAIELMDEVYVRIKNDPPMLAVAATAENLMTMLKALGLKGKKK